MITYIYTFMDIYGINTGGGITELQGRQQIVLTQSMQSYFVMDVNTNLYSHFMSFFNTETQFV